MKHKPYPKYKPSGIDWIGEIPVGWHRTKIKHLAKRHPKAFIDGDWIELPYITNDGIRLIQTGNIGIGYYKEQGFRYISEETFKELNCTEVFPNDILICRLAEPVGRACLAPNLFSRMITSVDVCILKPNESHESRFIVYFFSSLFYLEYMIAQSRGGTRDRVSRSFLGSVDVICPESREDQQKIADFLDKKTAQIDDLIQKKEEMIKLLKEKRAAIINQAVTKGLDPNVEMKSSGIDWLGKIPKHWEMKKVKYVANKVQTGITPPSEKNEYYDDGDIDWYTPGDFQESIKLRNSIRKISSIAIEKCVARVFPPYSVLLVGIGATLGKVGIVEILSSSNQQINVITFSNNFNPFFGVYYLQAITDAVISFSNASTLAILNQTQTKDILMLVPPEEEQEKIVNFLEPKISEIDYLINKIKSAIAKLREYRSSLITAAVTGKIDVRGAVKC